jgi:diguanylate cyclase (GGDEF)-like protein/PAS domain S-box-containing protein
VTRRAATDDELIAAIRAAIDDVIEGRPPGRVPPDEGDGPLAELARSVNRMSELMEELAAVSFPLMRGDLDAPLPSPDNAMAAQVVALHERLSRVVRQADAIARGDFGATTGADDHVSRAFDAMAQLLAEREASLKEQIARRQRAEEALQRERDLLVAGPLVTFRWQSGDEGFVDYVSPNIVQFGYRAEEFLEGGRPYADIVHPDDLQRIIDESDARREEGTDWWVQEYRLVDADGVTRWVRDYTHLVIHDDEGHWSTEGYIIDITEQKRMETALRRREEQLRMLSLADDLTGLLNRRGFFALGEYALRSAGRRGAHVRLLFIDIDGLSAVNERFGHRRGDEALRAVAAAVAAVARESDIAARTGGDEFAVLLEDGPAAADGMERRLRRRLTAASPDGGRLQGVTFSVGAADWQAPGEGTLQDLFERAVERMRGERAAKSP